ncbi:MAG: hypothetical protein NTW38_01535, partial [Candidatus Aminicenantes bacterium]|nr:hypothetical protein [Candidatus Aminicenantes bacterium]
PSGPIRQNSRISRGPIWTLAKIAVPANRSRWRFLAAITRVLITADDFLVLRRILIANRVSAAEWETFTLR